MGPPLLPGIPPEVRGARANCRLDAIPNRLPARVEVCGCGLEGRGHEKKKQGGGSEGAGAT
jgi:hypothetical protein